MHSDLFAHSESLTPAGKENQRKVSVSLPVRGMQRQIFEGDGQVLVVDPIQVHRARSLS